VKNFLKLTDFTLAEHRRLFERAAELKQRRAEGLAEHTLGGKTLVMLMEKASTRTRLSFAAAAFQLGGSAVELAAGTSQLARGEPLSDTARVVSGYADAVVMRTSSDARLEELARYSSIPVINGLTDGGHPVQVLTDAFAEAAPLFGFDLWVGAPAAYSLPAADVDRAGGRVKTTTEPRMAVRNAEVVITDVWTSMGQEAESAARLKAFAGFTVDAALMAYARPGAIVLHCLPAHRGEEITAEVLEGPASRVWVEAENRMHVQKALLEHLILHPEE